MRKFTVFLLILLYPVAFNLLPVYADARLDNGINFLKSKQDPSGKITGGFGATSQWAAIAFEANGVDVASVKNPTVSLKDFLLTDIPASSSAATDWESRILAAVAMGDNPSNFNGVDLLQNLQNTFSAGQIGESCSLNDDVFGLLALLASGSLASPRIKQDTLQFLISKQDSDGGFSWSAPGCGWYQTAVDMTAAAIQALQAAKDNGLAAAGLDEAIAKAKNYLLSNQNSDGGFGYFGSSDADTTGWALMALNVLGMKDTTEAQNARAYLFSKQDSDGGFLSWDGSNTVTTAHALIGLNGKDWILNILAPAATASATPSATPSPAPISSPTPSPTPTPTPTSTPAPTTVPTPTPTPSPTPTPTPLLSPTPSPAAVVNFSVPISTPLPSPSPQILGESKANEARDNGQLLTYGFKSTALPVAGIFTLFATFKFLEGRRWKK